MLKLSEIWILISQYVVINLIDHEHDLLISSIVNQPVSSDYWSEFSVF